jgi:hypothetical protein
MMQEREPQKESARQSCNYCGPGYSATWEIVSSGGQVFVCDKHHTVLQQINAIEKERLLVNAEWTMIAHFEEDQERHKLEKLDEWEDLDNWMHLYEGP